jgi:hypothetical protein
MTVTQRQGIQMLKATAVFDEPSALDRLLDSLAPRSGATS